MFNLFFGGVVIHSLFNSDAKVRSFCDITKWFVLKLHKRLLFFCFLLLGVEKSL